MIDRGGQRREVHMFIQNQQRIAKLVELRLTFLVGEQAVLDNWIQVRDVSLPSCQN
jgi:hypothetical protein